jgi:hypothetical protein
VGTNGHWRSPLHGPRAVEVLIPDANADGGPFVHEPSERATFTAHGEWDIPWPVFRRFIEVIAASGDLV